MTHKALTVVVLRLFAIMNFINALVALPAFLSEQFLDLKSMLLSLIYPVGILIIAVALWLVAHRLAALATQGIDGPLSFTALTREDIYCCAFVVLGLNFVLGSIGAVLTELYQYIQLLAGDVYPANSRNQLTSPLVQHGLTLIAGMACLLGAQTWTRKLLRLDQKKDS